MRQVTVSTSLVNTVHAMLASGLMVLASLVVLQTQLVSSASAEVTFLNKWGSAGSGDGQFNYPYGVALSDTGQVYVTDKSNHRIQRFDADGNYETKWGSYGGTDGVFNWTAPLKLKKLGL